MIGPGSEITPIQRRQAIRFPVEELPKSLEKFRLAILAEPLNFVLVLVRAQAGEFRDTRVEPPEGIGKFQMVKLANFVAVPERDQTGLGIGAAVERENERAIEAGGVVSAGGMAKMMFEMRWARAAAEKVLKLLLSGGFGDSGSFLGGIPFRKRDGPEIGEAQTVLVEAAFQREPRNIRAFLTAEFFFFNGKEDGLFVDESYGGAAAEGRDAEDMHELCVEGGHFRDRLRQTDQMFAVSVCDADREPLIVRQHIRNHNRKIVAGESGSVAGSVVRTAMKGENTERAAYLR